MTGRGGIPAGATAVTGNLTVTGQTQAGYLFVGPVATNSPSTSTLNFPKGDNRANGVTVALSGSGSLSVTYVAGNSTARTQAIFDVTGYFTADASGATYHAVSPTRLLDTRAGNGLSGTFESRIARTFQVTGRGGIPAGATAVTGNLTVTGQTQAGYLFVGPVATNSPSTSTLNFPKGDDRANGVTVALSGSGSLSVTYVAGNSTARTQAIFDVTGYFTSPTPAPTVTNVNPTSGPTAGGTSVTITGTNLSAATSVNFGATAGAIISNSATQIDGDLAGRRRRPRRCHGHDRRGHERHLLGRPLHVYPAGPDRDQRQSHQRHDRRGHLGDDHRDEPVVGDQRALRRDRRGHQHEQRDHRSRRPRRPASPPPSMSRSRPLVARVPSPRPTTSRMSRPRPPRP